MKRTHHVIIGIVATGLVGVIVAEHVIRRSVERRYQNLLGRQRQLEMEYAEMAATHHSLTTHLEEEQRRSQELAGALAATRAKLEETVGRLAEENRNAGELKMRLASVEEQMNQLQGELVAVLHDRANDQGAQPQQPIQLERVVVSSTGAPGVQGRIISVHQDWNFVIIELGWNAVRIGDTVLIVRDDQVLAQARIERVQEGVCAATVLPEWDTDDIRVNDLARLL